MKSLKVLLVSLALLFIHVPFATFQAEAATQMSVYQESYYYSYQEQETLGSHHLLTNQEGKSYLPLTDIAAILGLTLSEQNGNLYLDGDSFIQPNRTADRSLPKDPTIQEGFIIQANIGAQAGYMLTKGQPQPIFSKNANQALFPSSTTKIMTALLALEHGNLNDIVTVGPGAATVPRDSSKANIHPGDRLTLEQLLYAMMLPSGNDAAVAVAEHIAGSHWQFVNMMNARASSLGLSRTHFMNAHGYHHPRQVTTVAELAVIAEAASQYPAFMKIAGSQSYQARYVGRDGRPKTQNWRSTNALIRTDSNYFTATVTGGKTGYTRASRYNLVSFARANGHDYITVLLRGERNQRYVDTRVLLNRAYSERARLGNHMQTISTSPYQGQLFVNQENRTNETELFHYNNEVYASIDLIAKLSSDVTSVKRSDQQQLKASLDKQILTFDLTGPIIQNGRMLVPVRSFFEEAGLALEWDGSTKTIRGQGAGTVISMQLNSTRAYINGQAVTLDVPATIENGRTLVPVRFVSEATNREVDWGRSRTLYLY